MLSPCRRLLSTDPEAAKEVVLAEKPVIADTSSNLEPALLDILLANLSTLSSVYHKPPEVGQLAARQYPQPSSILPMFHFTSLIATQTLQAAHNVCIGKHAATSGLQAQRQKHICMVRKCECKS